MTEFNEMLAVLGVGDKQLRQRNDALEQQVLTCSRELAVAHDQVRLLLESLPFILVGLNPAGNVTLWNNTASNIFGIGETEAKGHPFGECGIKWHKPEEMQKQISSWLKTNSMLRCDDVGYYSKDEVRFVGFSVKPLVVNHGERVGFIVTGAEVTERKALEEQLRQAHK